MSTRGEVVRAARSGRSVDVGGVVAIRVAMLSLLAASVLDRDLLRRRLGSAGELHPEDPVGEARLGPLRIETVAHIDGPRERAERPFAPVILLLGHPGIGVSLTADGHGLAEHADVEARS